MASISTGDEGNASNDHTGGSFMAALWEKYRRLCSLIAIMATVALAGTGIASWELYESAFEVERSRLTELVRSQARLLEAVAEFDAANSRNDHVDGAAGATIQQMVNAHKEYKGFGATGTFHLVGRDGNGLKHLIGATRATDRPLGASSMMMKVQEFEPAKRALNGESGSMVLEVPDHPTVLAAYEPVKILDVALVAHIDLAEIRAPFVRAALISGSVAVVLIVLGAMLFVRINGGTIRQLTENIGHLKVAETRLSDAQRIAHIGNWEWDIATKELYCSDETCRIFGRDPELFECSYDAFQEAIHPDDREDVNATVKIALSERLPYSVEHRLVRPDGEIRIVHNQGEATYDEEGEPLRLSGTVQDITERKKAEETSNRFGRILDLSVNEFYVFDAVSLLIVHANETGLQSIGYTMDELRHMAPYELSGDLTREKFQQALAPLRDGTKQTVTFETVRKRKDGSGYPIEVQIQHFDNEDPPVFVATVLNITERKAAEQEIVEMNRNLEQRIKERTSDLAEANEELQGTLENLRQTQDQLVEAEKMASLGGLVAGVAHEVNTPIGIGVTAASHLKEGVEELRGKYDRGDIKRADLEQHLAVAEQSSAIVLSNLARASDLIRSFKQVAVDQSSEEERRFDLREYLDEIVISLRPNLKKAKHEVAIDCEAGLVVETYPGAVSQVVTNLIMNAITHAYDEGESGKMRITADDNGDGTIALTFSDDGKGIPEENLAKIFDPFFTTRRGSGGSGLGLNIVYNLVTQKLGGTIGCESETGEGTTFRIAFRGQSGSASNQDPETGKIRATA